MITTIHQWSDLSRRSFVDSFPAVQRRIRRHNTALGRVHQVFLVQSLPEEVYSTMHSALINSANDKDAAVLAHGEDPAAVEEGVHSLTDILRNLTQFDPSPDVRPAVHMQLNKQTLPVLLSRVKDPGATVCCTVFRVLNPLLSPLVHFRLSGAPYLLAILVDGTQDLEAFISLFDQSSDKTAEGTLGVVLAERPEYLDDIDLSNGENRSGLASTTDALTRRCRILMGRNDTRNIAARTRLFLTPLASPVLTTSRTASPL